MSNRHSISSLDFIKAGAAIFTIDNGHGTHYTFRVNKHKRKELWFVQLLTGPDNSWQYSYIGMLQEDQRNVRCIPTKASRMLKTSVPITVFNWALTLLKRGVQLPPGYTIMHEGRCARCGRRLTVPESIKSGFGPECISHVRDQATPPLFA